MHQGGVRLDDGLWLLGGFCQLHGIAFDADLSQAQAPPQFDTAALISAGRALGLELVTYAVRPSMELGDLPTPFVAWRLAAGDAQTPSPADSRAAATPSRRPVLVLRLEGDRWLYLEPGSVMPQAVRTSEFGSRFDTDVLLAKRVDEVAHDDDVDGMSAGADDASTRQFGLRWFLPAFMQHRRIWRDVLIVSLALQLLGLATPLLTQVVVDKVVVHHTYSTLAVVGVGLGVALLFSAAFGWLRQYLVTHTGNRIDALLGSAVWAHLLRLPLPFFHHRPTGVLVARLRGVETVREFIAGSLVTLLLDLPFMVVLMSVMFVYSWQLSLIALALVGSLAALSLAVTPMFRARLDRQFLAGARNQSFVTEYTAGIETVKSLQMEAKVEQRYGALLADYLAAGFGTRQLGNTYSIAANALEQAQTLAILVVGALLVMSNDGFTVGMLVAFQMFAGRLSQPLLKLVGLYQELQQVRVAAARLGDIMDMPREPHSLRPARFQPGRPATGARIELQDVAFRYDERQPWLYRHLHLTIPAGKAVAITGPSGSGKSTLAKLLQGFYVPQEGRLLIDGTDLRHLSANQLRANFGVVPQETVLFSGTLYDNLLAANSHATFDDVVTACRMAGVHDFIESLAAGYQTEVGERGVGLSGGQRQRIAIARALLKRPRVLIFDEATSALDAATAEQFARTINTLKGSVTLLFIAHHVPKALQIDGVVQIAPKSEAAVQRHSRLAEPS